MNRSPSNKKVAKSRGNKWKKSLIAGRLDNQRNPSVLKIARIDRVMTQAMFAKKVGVHTNTLVAIESSKRKVTKERAIKIAKALRGKTQSQLFYEVSPNKYLAVRINDSQKINGRTKS